MTEEQVKFLCKWIVDNSNRPLTEFEKELIKQAIDNSKNPQEMVVSVLALLKNMQKWKSFPFIEFMIKTKE